MNSNLAVLSSRVHWIDKQQHVADVIFYIFIHLAFDTLAVTHSERDLMTSSIAPIVIVSENAIATQNPPESWHDSQVPGRWWQSAADSVHRSRGAAHGRDLDYTMHGKVLRNTEGNKTAICAQGSRYKKTGEEFSSSLSRSLDQRCKGK